MKKTLIIALWCALAVGGGVLYPFWGVGAASIVYEQNFNNLNLGIIDGQDAWTASDFDVYTGGSYNYDGTYYLRATGAYGTFNRNIPTTTNLILEAKFLANDGYGSSPFFELVGNGKTIASFKTQWLSGESKMKIRSDGVDYIFGAWDGQLPYRDFRITIDSVNAQYKILYAGTESAWYPYADITADGTVNNFSGYVGGNGVMAMENLSISGDVVIPPPVITSPANGATIDAAVTPVSGTCDVIAGYESVFVQSATSTRGIIAESFANCDNGVWATNTSTPLLIFQGGQEVRAFLAENNNLNNRSTSSNIITLWGGSAAGTYWTTDTPLPTISSSGATEMSLTDKLKAPLVLYSNLKTKIDSISTATTSAFYLVGATTTAMMTNFFTPTRTGFAIVLYLMFAVYVLKRIFSTAI
jgi:hypothetical protein